MANSLTAMVGTGTSPPQAAAISGNVQTGVIALGTTQANAFAVFANFTHFATVAAATGAVLPPVLTVVGTGAQQGDEYEVYNLGANALLVYPGLGAGIGAGAANAGFSVPAGKSGKFVLLTTVLWGAILSA